MTSTSSRSKILPKQVTSIKSLPIPETGTVVYRGEGKDAGLMLEISCKGTKTWCVRYYAYRKGKRCRPKYKLGRFPSTGLEQARAKKLKLLAKVENGLDPALDKKVEKRKSEFKDVSSLVDAFFKQRETELYKGRKRRNVDDERSMAKCYILPVIGQYAPYSVTSEDIQDVLDKAQLKCSATRANRILALLRVIFKFGLVKKCVDVLPTEGVNRPQKDETARKIDPLTTKDLRQLWNLISFGNNTVGDNPALISHEVQIVLKLLLLTGQRSAEVSQAPLNEFDLEDKVWIISGSRTKNGQPHKVPLSSTALELVEEAMELAKKTAPRSKYLFPGWPGKKNSRRGSSPIGKTAPHHALKRVTVNTTLNWLNVHDFRKICATQMAELGISVEVISQILNHSINTVTMKHYAKPSYLPQMRTALQAWADRVAYIVRNGNKSGNVIQLNRGKN